MLDSNLSRKDVKKFTDEVSQLDGVKQVLGLDSLMGSKNSG
jgi:hypothetical protein